MHCIKCRTEARGIAQRCDVCKNRMISFDPATCTGIVAQGRDGPRESKPGEVGLSDDMSDTRVLVIAVLPCGEVTLLGTPSMAPVSYFVNGHKRGQMAKPRKVIALVHDNILKQKPSPKPIAQGCDDRHHYGNRLSSRAVEMIKNGAVEQCSIGTWHM